MAMAASPATALSNSARALGRVAAPYMEGLNPEQLAAVEALDGPVLVLAGAGTGKTRVLTTRIAHILCSGRAQAWQILAVTFTNKAAREMKERIGQLVGGALEGMPWLGTFHAVGVKILRRHGELVGLKSGFTILDVDDQLRLVKQVIEGANLDKDRWPARQLAALIDGWKNRGVTPDKVPRGEAFAFAEGKGAQLYAAYQQRLKELNAVDFGDLLLETIRLFRENPDVLADYQRRFRYILVDEYQDTNVAQYLWLRLLAGSDFERLLRRRRRPVHLRLARGRGGQHPALRGRFPWRQGDPPGAQLPLHRAHPGRCRRSHRPQQGPARQDAVHRRRHGRAREPHGAVGRRGGGAHHLRRHRGAAQGRPAARRHGHPGAGVLPDARLRGPVRHPRAPL